MWDGTSKKHSYVSFQNRAITVEQLENTPQKYDFLNLTDTNILLCATFGQKEAYHCITTGQIRINTRLFLNFLSSQTINITNAMCTITNLITYYINN